MRKVGVVSPHCGLDGRQTQCSVRFVGQRVRGHAEQGCARSGSMRRGGGASPAARRAPAGEPPSLRKMWERLPRITSSARPQCAPTQTRFPMVPVGTNRAASLPSSAAMRDSSSFTVGSSPNTSSPTSASAMARRMPSLGLVSVSDRRSTTRSTPAGGVADVRRRSECKPRRAQACVARRGNIAGVARSRFFPFPALHVTSAHRLHQGGPSRRICLSNERSCSDTSQRGPILRGSRCVRDAGGPPTALNSSPSTSAAPPPLQ